MMMQILANNVELLFSSPSLAIEFLSCMLFGVVAFVGAVKLCGSKHLVHRISKYILAITAIVFISKTFIYLLAPKVYLLYSPLVLIAELSLGFVLVWTLLSESIHLDEKRLSARNIRSIRIK